VGQVQGWPITLSVPVREHTITAPCTESTAQVGVQAVLLLHGLGVAVPGLPCVPSYMHISGVLADLTGFVAAP
jgi:hypothetical protein